MRDIALALPTKTPGQQRQRGLLESAVNQLNWDGVKSALMAYGGFTPPAPNCQVKPRAAGGGHTARRWWQSGRAARDARWHHRPYPDCRFFGQVARMIEYALPALGHDDERFSEQAPTLLKALRQPTPTPWL